MCLIWESCKHQATCYCFECEENGIDTDKNYYQFNNWEEDEDDDD